MLKKLLAWICRRRQENHDCDWESFVAPHHGSYRMFPVILNSSRIEYLDLGTSWSMPSSKMFKVFISHADSDHIVVFGDSKQPIYAWQSRMSADKFESTVIDRMKLFRFMLDKKTRERVYEPTCEDLKRQYALARRYKGKWEKRWLAFAFWFRAVVMILDCIRVMLQSAALMPFAKIMPEIVVRWWLGR